MRSTSAEQRGAQRVVSGTVASSGAVQSPGTCDWTVTKTGTGTFVLRFSPPFRAAPSITFGAVGSAIAGANPIAADSATVLTANGSLAAMDAGFYFHAEGRPL